MTAVLASQIRRRSRRLRWRLAGLAIALLVVFGAASISRAPSPAAAQTQVLPRVGVVFAIDNSGSMGVSDPTEQRIVGVRSLLNVVKAFVEQPQHSEEVSVGALSFNSGSPALLSPLVDVRTPPTIQAENRGDTDFVGALCGAWTVAARRAPPAAAGCALEQKFIQDASAGQSPSIDRRLVVLITDGSPAIGGKELPFDGRPSAGACPSAASTATQAGDTYFCSLAATWDRLTREVRADLVVIGLDAADEWFARSEPYWQRIVRCGQSGEPPCRDSIVRTVDSDQLRRMIFSSIVGIDLCPKARVGGATCTVPGGLSSVGFLVTGLGSGATTQVSAPGRPPLDSRTHPPELNPGPTTSHSWSVPRPPSGAWTVTGPAAADIYIQYVPTAFKMEVKSWDRSGVKVALTTAAAFDVPSALSQHYALVIQQAGQSPKRANATMFADGGGYSVTASLEQPPAGTAGNLVLYLVVPRGEMEMGRTSLGGAPTTSPPTPSPTPIATPPPQPDCPPECPPGLSKALAVAAAVAVALGLPLAISWFAVRSPQSMPQVGRAPLGPTAPIHLGLRNQALVEGLVRGGVFVYRRVPGDDNCARIVTMQWIIAGPLVVRTMGCSSGESGGESGGFADVMQKGIRGEPLDVVSGILQRIRPADD